jgi:transcription elongation GreA/GreB family factor
MRISARDAPGGRRRRSEQRPFMSVAFTREESAETAAEFQLPDRPLSPYPNLVTASGLKALEAALAQANRAYKASQQIEDVNERRRSSAPAYRDIRYFTERLRTAQLVPPASRAGALCFGDRVTFTRNEGPPQSFRIVGEDEAEPRQGSISYVSPLARVLIGKAVGDSVLLGDDEIVILSIGE